MSFPLISLRIQYEEDVVSARQRTREVAEALGFDIQQQTRLATAVSEIARNAFSYAGGGKAEFFLEGNTAPQQFSIRIADQGQGIPNLDRVLAGTCRSESGMGLGIVGTQRLMDRFRIDSVPGKGTVVTLGKLLPPRVPVITARSLPGLLDRIAQQKPKTVLDAFREQNKELLRTMDELRSRQDELSALNRELEDTNSGVVALYAELDDKANHLRRADEMKSRFLFNMSHEFRTPLNSIQALSRMLLNCTDGELTGEQEIQISYIRKSAESLSDLVNDLLDIAKVEAGKIEIRPVDFEAGSLFGALRGMLKPLLVSNSVDLIFEDASGLPPVYSDEVRVSQILRNFISNSMKFTEAGEVRVSAVYEELNGFVRFDVRDTGIGIAPEHQEHVFEEFTQLDHYLQRGVKGTGLGLPLSRKLAQLLGGEVTLQSEVGTGSTFSLRIPRIFGGAEGSAEPLTELAVDPKRKLVVLLVEQQYETRLEYEKHLTSPEWNAVFVRSAREGEALIQHSPPSAVVIDIRLQGDIKLQGEDCWSFLTRLKANRATRGIPVIIAGIPEDRAKAETLGADAFLLQPLGGERLREALKETSERLTTRGFRTVLLVDDDEAARYLAKQLFTVNVRFTEAQDGAEALGILRTDPPDLVVMDLSMPIMNGFQTMEAMEADAALRNIPVVISTSAIPAAQADYLKSRAIAILQKDKLLEPETALILGTALSAAGLGDLHYPRAALGRAM